MSLNTDTPLNPIQKAMEDAKINKELDEQQEILAAETDNSVGINKLFETVYKAAEGALAPTTLSGYTEYISYIFCKFNWKYLYLIRLF